MLISIVVPIYNSEKYLKECIHSILEQTYTDWELLLINDGSSDSSWKTCLYYSSNYSKISYYKKENGGVSSARNFGIEKAKGEYITFVDSDDFLDSNYLNNLVNKLRASNATMAVSGLKYYLRNGNEVFVKYRLPSGVYTAKEINQVIVDDGTLSGFTFHSSCAILFDLSIIRNNDIHFNEKLKFNEDGLFVTEYCLKMGNSKIIVDFGNAYYFYRVNNESASKNIDAERYILDMQSIEKVLKNYDIEELKNQLLYRNVTIKVDLFGIYGKQGNLTYKIVRDSLKNESIISGIRLLKINKQNSRAKMALCYLLKCKAYFAIYLLFNFRKK